ncbi:DUF3365 domain-containing protein [bacterium]|nr:DUF3365 domain-containing protein [bacterium]
MQTMPPSPSQRNRPSDRIWHYALLVALMWTAIILASGSWASYNSHLMTLQTARIEARASFNNDLIYRHWASSHGGVYVPVTEDTPPNAYLDVPNRDVITTDGQQLTLINPAYMTRQVHEMAAEAYGTRSHITSLNPIRPANAPDDWERAALLTFEQGVMEASSVEMIDGEPVMRYMHVMIAEEHCLTCHTQQGYQLGDVRGGISVSVPMQPYWDTAHHNDTGIVYGHVLVWFIGISAVLFSGRRFVSSARREEDFTQRLQQNALRYRQMFHDNRAISLVIDPQTGRIVEANRSASAFYGYTARHLQSLKVSDLRTDAHLDAQALPCPQEPAQGFYAQRHRLASGSIRDVDVFASPLDTEEGQRLYLIIVDATARREAEAQRQQAEEALRRSKAYLESMLDTQNAFVLRTDLNGDYTYVNETLYQRFTWMYPSREAMQGTPSMMTIIPEDHTRTFEVVQQCFMQPGQTFQVELRKPSEGGGFFWALWDFVALTDAVGDVTEIQCIGIDMTDRKQRRTRVRAGAGKRRTQPADHLHPTCRA